MKKLGPLLFAFVLFLPISVIYADDASGTKYDNTGLQVVDGDPMARSVNLRIYVPEVFVGYLGGVWDIGISPVMSFGPIVRVFTFGKYDGYAFGVNANYSLSGNLFKSGFILNPYIEYYHGNYDQPFNQFGVRPKESTIVVCGSLLYQWMFRNGFNVMVGLGLEYADEKIPVTMIGDGDFHGHYEVTIGYAF